MFTISAMSLLLRVVEPSQRGRASGVFPGGFLDVGIAGPAVGGFVTAGSPYGAPFFLTSITSPSPLCFARHRDGLPGRRRRCTSAQTSVF
jgi:hypothetical protein